MLNDNSVYFCIVLEGLFPNLSKLTVDAASEGIKYIGYM